MSAQLYRAYGEWPDFISAVPYLLVGQLFVFFILSHDYPFAILAVRTCMQKF